MPHIAVLDDLSAEGLAMLDEAAGITWSLKTGLKGDALREALMSADGAICRSGVKITAESLAGNRRLKAIVRAGVGTDNIDKAAATRLGIIVMNTPAGNTVSTAEHTLALLLGLARQVAPAHASLCSGKWDRRSHAGVELKGKTIGIVGLGRIGQAVAARCRAFEMKVVGFDPFLPREKAESLGIPLAESIEAILPEVDFLTVHTPLTPETEGLINSTRLAMLRPGVRLINCARGGIYDESALVEGLQSGRIAGVALDVFAEEPCTASPLFGLPGVLVTPHLGASTEEAQKQVATEAVVLLVRFLQSGEICHAVNALAVDPQTLRRTGGQLDLCCRMGILLAQWHGGPVENCRLAFSGDLAGEDTRLFSAAFCTGLLASVLDGVNFVNAEMLCRERGIEITREVRGGHGTFQNLINISTTGAGGELEIAGTLFGKSLPRLVRWQQFQLESYLDGNLLVFAHDDVPGIIGFVGQVLAGHRVNIGQMAVGRSGSAPGGHSIGILNLDSPAPPGAVAEIATHPQIRAVRQIELPPPGPSLDLPGL